MSPDIQFHPLSKSLAKTVFFFVGLVGIFLLLSNLSNSNSVPAASSQSLILQRLRLTTDADLLLPVLSLDVPDALMEIGWSKALAKKLNGETEYIIESGRVDVLTDRYAIEVERMQKWHEAIGQVSHYAMKTGKLPMVALIVASDSWPLSLESKAKIQLIEEACLSKAIKLLILRRSLEFQERN